MKKIAFNNFIANQRNVTFFILVIEGKSTEKNEKVRSLYLLNEMQTYQSLINPFARNGNFSCYNTFTKHVAILISFSNAKLLLIWDFIVLKFDRCNNTFDKFFLSFRTLNFDISRHKI